MVGSGLAAPCDRLPLEVTSCPVCGSGIKFTRTLTKVNAYRLWGKHDRVAEIVHSADFQVPNCTCPGSCYVCTPPDDISYIMGVGEKYYSPQSFITEAQMMGVCKRIPQVPQDLELGKTVIYLTHKRAIYGNDGYKTGLFYAFRPHKIEKLIWESEATPEELEKLEKRGITPVRVPDGDADHR